MSKTNTVQLVTEVAAVVGASAFVGVYIWYMLKQKELARSSTKAEIGYGGTCGNDSRVEVSWPAACPDMFPGSAPDGQFCRGVNLCNDGTQTARIVGETFVDPAHVDEFTPRVNLGEIYDDGDCAAIGGVHQDTKYCWARMANVQPEAASALIYPPGKCPLGMREISANLPNIPNVTCRTLGGIPTSDNHCRLALCTKK